MSTPPTITYDNVVSTLLERVPEFRSVLKPRMGEVAGPDGAPMPYIVLESVFQPWIFTLLGREDGSETLQQTFTFIEDIVRSRDPKIDDLIKITIIDDLVWKGVMLHRAWPLMLEQTRLVARAQAQHLGCESNLPKN